MTDASDSIFGDMRWKASRYTSSTNAEDGSLLLYSSMVGAVARVSQDDTGIVSHALVNGFNGSPAGPLAELALNGFFVDSELDEIALAASVRKRESHKTDALELSILPTERCNFRCVYCYESFLKGKMQSGIRDGIVEFVRRRAESLTSLHVGWFGGEPLTASDVVADISARLLRICAQTGTSYSSAMVTNGYLLNSAMADMLFQAQVRDFQITLDGGEDDHNRLRLLADKTSNTFAQIFSNLVSLRDRKEYFRVIIRVNFDPDSATRMERFVEKISATFAGDERFFIDFHPVGRWGGPNDGSVPVCDSGQGFGYQTRFFGTASKNSLSVRALRQRMEPSGSVCYAANPRSFVIGSDGIVYKCTVAFDDPANHVGRITPDGELQLDQDKLAMWTGGGAEKDEGCQACFFSPSCQGNACPLERIRTGSRPCPSTKATIGEAIRVVAADAMRRQGSVADLVQISV